MRTFELVSVIGMIMILTLSISELKDRVSKIHYELDKKITDAQIKCTVHEYLE
jgi:hypothetical protein